jgi:hypothetical protein
MKTSMRSMSLAVAAIATGLVAVFFAFYTARLLYVTHGLQTLRAGGRGAYVGALVFPVIAIGAAWCSRRLTRAARAASPNPGSRPPQ